MGQVVVVNLERPGKVRFLVSVLMGMLIAFAPRLVVLGALGTAGYVMRIEPGTFSSSLVVALSLLSIPAGILFALDYWLDLRLC